MFYTGVPPAFEMRDEFAIRTNNLLGELEYLGEHFEITFQVYFDDFTPDGADWNILHFTTGETCCGWGTRIPLLRTYGQMIGVVSAINGHGNWHDNTNLVFYNRYQWIDISISQMMDKDNKVSIFTLINHLIYLFSICLHSK